MDVVLIAATRRNFYRRVLQEDGRLTVSTEKIEARNGDRFFGLDLSAHLLWPHRQRLQKWRREGVHFTFVVYDLFPLRRPEWFSRKLANAFRRWIIMIAILADELLCISKAVSNDTKDWLQDHYRLGTDISVGLLPIDLSDWRAKFAPTLSGNSEVTNPPESRFLLAVGTIEPRKAQEQLLDAFEILWRQGCDIGLVIAGRPGWKTTALQNRLRAHPEQGHRLTWHENPSDAELGELYRSCQGTILASHAEGLGLPLLEAIDIGKPVLTRDLDVYREIISTDGLRQTFAIDATPDQLAMAIRIFMADLESAQERDSGE